MSEHTPTPWVYRPHRHDDWGWIRAPKQGDDEIGPLVAIARLGDWRSDEKFLDEHRRNKTDPYGANAAFIVKAVNSHEALVKALVDTLCELSHCAMQLEARGLPGRDGDSVSRAQKAARDILALVGGDQGGAA